MTMTMNRACSSVFVLALLTTAAQGCAAGGEPAGEGVLGSSKEPVYQGDTATSNPFNVVIVNGSCTGTLLTRDWILTASHCTGDQPMAMGITFNGTAYTSLYHVEHGTLDAALIKLPTKVTLPQNGLLTNTLWYGSSSAIVGQSLLCYGYGNNAANQTGFGTLRTATLPVGSVSGNTFTLNPNSRGQSLMQGDSGSSCWYTENGIPYIAGITNTGGPGLTAGLTGAWALRDWADETINGDTALQLPGGQLPGSAKAVGLAEDVQTAWVVGSDNNVYRWSSTATDRWEQVGTVSGLTSLDVGRDLNAYATTSGDISKWDGSTWGGLGYQGFEVGASQDGITYSVGPTDLGAGYQILMNVLNTTPLVFPGAADHIDADAAGGAWAINRSQQIYRRQRSFQSHGGVASDVAAGNGSPGNVWVIGGDSAAYRWNGAGFDRKPVTGGPAFQAIASDQNGNPRATNSSGIFAWNGTSWTSVSAPEVPVDLKYVPTLGSFVFLGPSGTLYQQAGSSWTASTGQTTGVAFAYDPSTSNYWIVRPDHTIVTRTFTSATTTAVPLTINNGQGATLTAKDIGIGGSTDQIWVSGSADGTSFSAYHWVTSNSSWDGLISAVSRIDVGPEGEVWVVGGDSGLYSMDWNFRSLPGAATEIALSVDGSVWIVGTNSFNGDGNQVYKWNEASWSWTAQSLGAKKLAPDMFGRVWFTTSSNAIKVYNGSTTRTLPGAGIDISTGSDGRPWVIGASPGNAFRYNGGSWQQVTGATASEIDVDGSGTAWIVDGSGVIRFSSGSSWTSTGTTGSEIGVSATGFVWRIGATTRTGGHSIEKLVNTNPYTWLEANTGHGGQRLDVDPQSSPWVCDSSGLVYRLTSSWVQIGTSSDTCVDIAIGSGGIAWKVNSQGQLARWNGSSWVTDSAVSGVNFGNRISAGALSKVIGRTSSSAILVR